MIVKNIIDEDFTNYKECSMFIGFPSCTFKCEKECNCPGMCQNSELVKSPNIEISVENIIKRYLANPLSRALVLGGLEPFDSFKDLYSLIHTFRLATKNPVIIYTGYTKEELSHLSDKTTWSSSNSEWTYLKRIKDFDNIIIKFGRFIPNQEKHYDEVLGIHLASNNQYAEKIS